MTTILKNVPVGANFKVWERTYTVLEKNADSVLVLDTEVIRDISLMEDFENYHYKWACTESGPSVEPNNFKGSKLKECLNSRYLKTLKGRGAVIDTDILPLTIDLTDSEGRNAYGTDTVMVGCLTTEQFKKYNIIIPHTRDDWWLASPHRTSNNLFEFSSVFVNETGHILENGTAYSEKAARAALNLSLNLEVEYETPEKASNTGYDLSKEQEEAWIVYRASRDMQRQAWEKQRMEMFRETACRVAQRLDPEVLAKAGIKDIKTDTDPFESEFPFDNYDPLVNEVYRFGDYVIIGEHLYSKGYSLYSISKIGSAVCHLGLFAAGSVAELEKELLRKEPGHSLDFYIQLCEC